MPILIPAQFIAPYLVTPDGMYTFFLSPPAKKDEFFLSPPAKKDVLVEIYSGHGAC
jgi:hypothetical protein